MVNSKTNRTLFFVIIKETLSSKNERVKKASKKTPNSNEARNEIFSCATETDNFLRSSVIIKNFN